MTVEFMEAVAVELERTERYRVLRRMFLELPYMDAAPQGIHKAVVLDTETTGLDTKTAKITEIALRSLYYDPDGKLVGMGPHYFGFEDPKEPLSEEITRITGLNDAMLEGQSFNDDEIAAVMDKAGIFIAHNADYDCPLVERRFPEIAGRRWACTMNELPWKLWGCPSNALQVIAWWSGYMFQPHRAMADVDALCFILSLQMEERDIFAHLIEAARKPSFKVFANSAPFEAKDRLKLRGYKWDGVARVWSLNMTDNEAPEGEILPVDAELIWLRENASARPTVTELTAKERYR